DDVLAQLDPLQRQRLDSVALLDMLSELPVADLSGVDNGARLISEWQHLGYVQSNPQLTLQPLLKTALLRGLRADPAAYHAAIQATAAWFAAHDDFAAVARLAHKTQCWTVLMQTLEQYSSALLNRARFVEVIGWLAKIPDHLLSVEAGSLLVRCYRGINDDAGALLLLNQLLGRLTSAADQLTLRLLKASVIQAAGATAEADRLVAPYLHDLALAVADRARVLRIHGIALAAGGDAEAGLECLACAAALLDDQGASRLAGLVLADYARAAVGMGNYPLAERLLRQAERVWRDLSTPVPPDLACTLNLQAQVALHTGHLAQAERLAEAAYDHAVWANSARTIADILITQADIALARHHWDIAAARYQLAIGQLHLVGDLARLPYLLAMQAQAARHTSNLDTLNAMLQQLEAAAVLVPLDHAWLAAGKAAAYLHLGIAGGELLLEQALAALEGPPTLAHGLLTLLLAETHWANNNRSAAKAAWHTLDQLLLEGRGGLPILLGALANHSIGRLREGHLGCQTHFAGWVTPPTDGGSLPATPLLTLRVHGQTMVAWHDQVVKLPRHGILLLTLLLLSEGSGMTADELRYRLWGDECGSADSWRKLLQRVRKLLSPQAIVLENGVYRLGVPADSIDADVLQVRQCCAGSADPVSLRRAAAYAARPLLAGSEEAWVAGERKVSSLRGADLWYAVGNLERDERQIDASAAAYATALRLNPLSERAVVAAMTLALTHSQRCTAINIFQTYAQHMLDEMGLDPAPAIDALYRQALEP
ncbi:MAG: hypothetical protein H0T53_11865, partial [Herpetosiphonaceae bacterium]|nr:hypothetical protein [Herpetosiphonaceae bacterium]